MRLAPAAFAAMLAGCVVTPPPPVAPRTADAAPLAGHPFVYERERVRALRAEHKVMGDQKSGPISAEYNLLVESAGGMQPSAEQILRAHEVRNERVREAAMAKSAGIQPSLWQALGPSNVAGRVRALAFDPRDPRRLFAGTASGGLWLTEDGGATWRANQDFLPNLSITSIAFDARNPDVMYMGTGEASAGLVGIGMFKSTDAGRTWAFLPATSVDANPDWRFVNRVAVHPTQNVVLAGVTNDTRTLGGIYRSTDAGASWTRVFGSRALDVVFDPNNPSRVVAGLVDGTIAYSSDAGATWTRTSPLVATPSGRNHTARAEIAFARSQAGVVYASVDDEKGQVWRSDDAGASWQLVSTVGHLGNQGDYDNAIWVDPSDANHVVVAGLDAYQSRDGAQTFTKISDWRRLANSAHADHHQLVSPPNFGPGNPVLYDSNDGGVYRLPNVYTATPTSWENMNNGLAVTQFYSGAGRTAAGGRIIGGAQDNYSLMLTTAGSWFMWADGDGGSVVVDPVNDQFIYGEYVYAAVRRSLNGGTTSQFICTGITEAITDEDSSPACGTGTTQASNFIAPLVGDPQVRERIYVGAASLWVTDNARAPSVAWRAVKAPSTVNANYINAIAIAEGDSNTIWVGHNNGDVYRSSNGATAAPAWTSAGPPVSPTRLVNRITIDRDDRNHVFIALSGFTPNNLWETRDAGATWRSITGNLPQAPVFDIKRHPHKAGWLYAATSVGVFTSEDGGATWSTTNEGPANIRVRELFWIDDTTLGAATYGRGMFKVTVAAGGPDNYQDLWWSGLAENGWGMSIVQHRDVLFSELFIYDAAGRPLWVVMPGGSWDASFTRFTGPVFIPAGSYFAAYDVSRHSVGAQVGTATLTFAGRNAATLAYTINGASGTKQISRLAFGPVDSTPVASYGDLWWGGVAQNGWGVVLNQQYRTLFSLWYTYDRDGRPTWFVVPNGSWTAANTWSGAAYRASGAAWLGVQYDASRHALVPAGTMTFTFPDAQNASMVYTIDGVSGTNALTRLPF